MNKEELREKIKQLEDDNYQEKLHLHGQLLALIKKEYKEEKNELVKTKLRLELNEELKTHKQIIEVCKNKKEYIPLTKKVGLKIQEIATSIEIFKNKHDLIGKLKKAGINSIPSSILVIALSLGLSAFTGGISLATLTSLVPTLSYVGLSNLLRSFQDKTTLEKLIEQYDNKEENQKKLKDYLQTNIIENKTLLELLKKSKEQSTDLEKHATLEELIKQFDVLIQNAPTEEIKTTIQQEQTIFMKELKKSYEKTKEDYIQDKITLSFEEFTKLEKKLLALNMNIVENEYFLKDAALDAVKNTGSSLAIMIIARTILSAAFPSMGIKSINDLLTPTMIIALTNLLNIPKYKDKIPVVPTKYDGKTIKIDKEKLKETLQLEGTPSLQMA